MYLLYYGIDTTIFIGNCLHLAQYIVHGEQKYSKIYTTEHCKCNEIVAVRNLFVATCVDGGVE